MGHTAQGQVFFNLWGEFDPDEVTARLGIEPDRSWRKGSREGTDGEFPKTDIWTLHSSSEEGTLVELDHMASAVVARLAPQVEALVSVMQDLDLTASLAVALFLDIDRDDDTASLPITLGFDEDVVTFMAQVGGTIDVDPYFH